MAKIKIVRSKEYSVFEYSTFSLIQLEIKIMPIPKSRYEYWGSKKSYPTATFNKKYYQNSNPWLRTRDRKNIALLLTSRGVRNIFGVAFWDSLNDFRKAHPRFVAQGISKFSLFIRPFLGRKSGRKMETTNYKYRQSKQWQQRLIFLNKWNLTFNFNFRKFEKVWNILLRDKYWSRPRAIADYNLRKKGTA